MPTTKFISLKDEKTMEMAMAAVAAHPTLGQAVAYLKEAHSIVTTEKILQTYASRKRDEVEAMREQIAPRVEAIRANDMLDNMSLATELERLAMESLKKKLEKGWVKDEARVARDLADIKAKNVDKRLAMQGRPTQIIETRKLPEIIKQLESLGVAKQVTVETTAVEDGGGQ